MRRTTHAMISRKKNGFYKILSTHQKTQLEHANNSFIFNIKSIYYEFILQAHRFDFTINSPLLHSHWIFETVHETLSPGSCVRSIRKDAPRTLQELERNSTGGF